MSIPPDFKQQLYPKLKAIVEHFGTPFHIYDERGIRQNCRHMTDTFSELGFKNYFAVKALPNPHILKIIHEEAFGFDCSSVPELILSCQVGATGEDIMFTSNNTSESEFEAAFADGGSIINLDDIALLDKLPQKPDIISFRYNPGERRTGNTIIGNPVESKFGLSHDQMLEAYRRARDMGISRFGLHTMLVSNERDYHYMVETTKMLLELMTWISTEVGIRFEFINIGGGLGIPYHPDDTPLDLAALYQGIKPLFEAQPEPPSLYMECGRYVTGPHGVLVTQVINQKSTYRNYVGVDADMSALMRPGMYCAYHHIDVLGKDGNEQTVDVVGALCENNDKFAIQRNLPRIEIGDLLIIHDTGAHGQAMGFNYNGRLRPAELLLRDDGTVERIRRAQTIDDYFATLNFEPDILA